MFQLRVLTWVEAQVSSDANAMVRSPCTSSAAAAQGAAFNRLRINSAMLPESTLQGRRAVQRLETMRVGAAVQLRYDCAPARFPPTAATAAILQGIRRASVLAPHPHPIRTVSATTIQQSSQRVRSSAGCDATNKPAPVSSYCLVSVYGGQQHHSNPAIQASVCGRCSPRCFVALHGSCFTTAVHRRRG